MSLEVVIFGYSAYMNNNSFVLENVTEEELGVMEQYSTAYFQKLDLLASLYAGQAALKESVPTEKINHMERYQQIEAAIAKLNNEIRLIERTILKSSYSTENC